MPEMMTRGRFLAGVAAAAVAARAARAKRPPWPFFALCMDTHDACKRNLAQQAEMLKETGYDGAGHLWLENVPERIAALDKVGLKLFQIYARVDLKPGAKEPFDPRLGEVLPLLKGRPTQVAFLVSGAKPSDESLDARVVEIFREIYRLAQPYGVRIALYPHVKDWLERVEDGLRVVRKVDRPGVGVMFNLCHWMKTADEARLEALLRSALPYLYAISINGSDSVADVKAGTGNWIQPLGSGTFDMRGFLGTLHRLGYAGPVGLQCYGIPGDAQEHLARSMAAWRHLCGGLA
jgi:sugar phosphate isomerase/epimerase